MWLYKREHQTALPGESYIYKREKEVVHMLPKPFAAHFKNEGVLITENVGEFCTIDWDLQDHVNPVSALVGTPVTQEDVHDLHQRNEWLRSEREMDMQFELIDNQAETYELMAKMAAHPGDADVYAQVSSDLAVVKYKWLVHCEYKFLIRFFVRHLDAHKLYPQRWALDLGLGWSEYYHRATHYRAAAIIHYCRLKADANPVPASDSRKRKDETDEMAMARRIYEAFEKELALWRGIVTKWGFIEKSNFWNEHYAWDTKSLDNMRKAWVGDPKDEYVLDPEPEEEESGD